MKKLYLSACLLAIGCSSLAQAPVVKWAQQTGINQTSMVTAYTELKSLGTDSAHNIYAAGYFSGQTGDLDPGSGVIQLTSQTSGMGNSTADFLVLKYDSSGAIVWARQIGGQDNEYCMAAATDAEGNTYLTGYFYGTIDADPGSGTVNQTSSGGQDIIVIKLNANGDHVWSRKTGGGGNDQGLAIAVSPAGEVFLTGDFSGIADLDPGPGTSSFTADANEDVFVLKLNSSGNYEWAQQLPGDGNEYGNAIALDGPGNVVVGGIFNSNNFDLDPGSSTNGVSTAGGYDLFWLKLDGTGNYLWGKAASDAGTADQRIHAMSIDASGNIITTGYFASGSDVTIDSQNFGSAGSDDAYICKLNGTGALQWMRIVANADEERGNALKVDAAGDIYVGGHFFGTADLDPGAGTASHIAQDLSDAFLIKLNNSGNYVWSRSFGAARGQAITALAIADSLEIYAAGSFSAAIILDSFTMTCQIPPAVLYDGFIARLNGPATLAVGGAEAMVETFETYPNPAAGSLYIVSPSAGPVSVSDISGRSLLQLQLHKGANSVDISSLSPGLYLIRGAQGRFAKFTKE